jgi:succinate-semialdehyde dehydrogenase / glutarate-semialdehyde dehydrogenase
MRAGIIGINNATPNYPGAPFGGLGLSGVGYEGGLKGLEAFQSFHTVAEVRE